MSPAHSYNTVAHRYEQLRDQALRQLSTGLGLGVFVQRGMATWITAWGSYDSAKDNSVGGEPTQSQLYMDPEIVMILAGMAFSCTKGGRR